METTIEFTLLSYDIDKDHRAVKKILKNYGYDDSWYIGPKKRDQFMLTNTTMIHLNKNCNAAIIDLHTICTSLDVTIINSVALKAKDIIGTKKKPQYNFTPLGPHEF